MCEKKHNYNISIIIYSKILVFILIFLYCIIFLIISSFHKKERLIEQKELKRKKKKRKRKKRKRRNDKENKEIKEKQYDMNIIRTLIRSTHISIFVFYSELLMILIKSKQHKKGRTKKKGNGKKRK